MCGLLLGMLEKNSITLLYCCLNLYVCRCIELECMNFLKTNVTSIRMKFPFLLGPFEQSCIVPLLFAGDSRGDSRSDTGRNDSRGYSRGKTEDWSVPLPKNERLETGRANHF